MSDKFIFSIGSNTFFNLFANGFKIIINFLSTLLCARLLGIDEFGQLNLLLAYTLFMNFIYSMGYDQAVPIQLNFSDKIHDLFKALKYILIKVSIFSVPFTILFVLTTYYFIPSYLNYDLLLIMLAQTFIYSLQMIVIGFFRAAGHFITSNLLEQLILPLLRFSAIGAILIWPEVKLGSYVVAYSLGTAGSLVISLALLFKYGSRLTSQASSFDKKDIKGAYTMSFSATLEFLFASLNVYFLGFFVDDGAVGLFTLITRVSFFVQFLSMALLPVLMPFLGKARDLEGDSYSNIVNRTIYWNVKWSILFTFFLFNATDFILAVFGEEYSHGVNAFRIIIFGYFFESCFRTLRFALIAKGNQWQEVITILVLGFINIIASYFWIPTGGVWIASYLFSASYIALNLVRYILYVKQEKSYIFTMNTWIRAAGLITVVTTLTFILQELQLNKNIEFLATFVLFLLGLLGVFWNERDVFTKVFLAKK